MTNDELEATAEITEMEVRGLQKAYALLQKGMESQCELMDELKQQTRTQAAKIGQLRGALAKIVQEAANDCDTDVVERIGKLVREALADDR